MTVSRIINYVVWLLAALTSLFFVQLWPEIGSFTLRVEDLILLTLIALAAVPLFLTGKFRYRPSSLYLPLLVWAFVVLFGAIVTLSSSVDPKWKQDALVNSIRVALATSLFFAVYNYPASANRKIASILGAVVIMSLLTSFVSLLQIAHWNQWLPFSLPSILTEFKEGANTERGREIFGLFVGDTGTHTWSAMLAVQAMVVWFLAWYVRRRTWRTAALLYFALLTVIIIRTSVRNSILGLIVALASLFVITSLRSRFPVNKIVKPTFVVLIGIFGTAALFAFGSEYYFTQRIIQTIPQWQNGQLVIHGGSSIYGRLDYAATAIAIFQAHPLLGSGFFSFEPLSPIFGPIAAPHAHNSYLQTISELGIVGVLALIWLIWRIGTYLYATRGCLELSREARLIWQLAVADAIFLSFTALFSNTFWSPVYTAVFMLFLGSLASIVYEAQQ